jgi:hypothetical protein
VRLFFGHLEIGDGELFKMLATHAIENRVKQLMDALPISATVVGQLTGLYDMRGFSQARISMALSGAKPFENRQGERLLEFLREIQELVQTTGAPLLLSDSLQIKSLLDDRRAAQKLLKDEGYEPELSTTTSGIPA